MSDAPPERAAPRLGRPPDRTSEETFDQILVAARRRFAARGFGRTRNQEIAADAGVTSSALYHYFRSKGALYIAVYRDAERTMARRFRSAMEGCTTTPERIRAIADEATRLYGEDPSILNFVAGAPIEMRNTPELARLVAETDIEIFEVLASVVDAGIEGGDLPTDLDRDGAAYLISAMTVGVALLARTIGAEYYGRMLGSLAAVLDDDPTG